MGHQHRSGDDEARRAERARDVALFRYALIRQAADPALTTRARGILVRALSAVEHTGPTGATVRISRVSLDRWVRAWRTGGFDALLPSARHAEPRRACWSWPRRSSARSRDAPRRRSRPS